LGFWVRFFFFFFRTKKIRYNNHAPSAEEKIFDAIDSELEKSDYFGGFFVTLSIAGGTGSGVGKVSISGIEKRV
jgi:hypothetical protein